MGIGGSPQRKLYVMDSANGYNLGLQQTSAYNSGIQSGIVFAAPYNSGGSVTDLASIRGGKENTTDGNFAGNLRFYTRVNGGSDTERMRIDSSGNVGIGTASPAEKLNIDSGSLRIDATNGVGGIGSQAIKIVDKGNPSYGWLINLETSQTGNLKLGRLVQGTRSDVMEFARATGNVGIGTASPDSTLQVTQGYSSSVRAMIVSNGSEDLGGAYDTVVINQHDVPCIRLIETQYDIQSTWACGNENSNSTIIGCTHQLKFATGRAADTAGYTTSGVAMTIDASGNIGAPTGTGIYQASDQRLKQNISSLSNSLDIIQGLNPVKFNWIDNFQEDENDKTLYGFVAQEVQEIFPDAVESFGSGDDVEVDGTVVENPLTVRDKFFIPVLVKAMQEQQALIEAQATTITDLTARITTLENA